MMHSLSNILSIVLFAGKLWPTPLPRYPSDLGRRSPACRVRRRRECRQLAGRCPENHCIERICSFEPVPSAYAQLLRRYQNRPKVSVVNCELGSSLGTLELSDFGGLGCMNWFLSKAGAVAKEPIAVRRIEGQTVDEICAEVSAPRLSVSKTAR